MILWDIPPVFAWAILFIFGAVIGSFLNVCVYRLPRHENIRQAWAGVVDPPSSCPYCNTRIRPTDNVPIFGWLWLLGRCRTCRHRISFRYPLIEFLNGALFVALYVALVPAGYSAPLSSSSIVTELSPLATDLPHRELVVRLHLQFLYYLVFVEALLVASLIDFDLQIIPDSVTVPAMVVGLLGSLVGSFYLIPVWYQNPELVTLLWGLGAAPEAQPPWWSEVSVPRWCLEYPRWHGLAVSAAGFLVGGGVIWFVRIVGAWVFRREAMGFGDVILMAMIGSFLGWQPTLIVFFLAPICALVVVAVTLAFSRSREIPFGPYLSLGALVVVLGWRQLFEVSERFFSLGPFVPVLAVILGVVLILVLWIVQGCKLLLGIPLYDDDSPEGEWTAADQLAFFASKESAQRPTGHRSPEWPGIASGQGLRQQRNWQGR